MCVRLLVLLVLEMRVENINFKSVLSFDFQNTQ